jgi:signal transduction histidine kinase
MNAPDSLPVDILLVDDNPGKMLALESALAPLGENLVTASSGREALRQLLDRDFATVILDVNMPEMDGFETAQLIRSRKRSEHVPIIFVSAVNIDETDARRGYSLGAVDYIFAPIIPEVLRAKVAVFVDLHRKREEAHLHARRLEERGRQLEQSQRQLRMAERMAAIGTLCAGLGHDMGNLLLPIMARLESMRRQELPADVDESLETIATCVSYLRRLSSGLRLLALDPEKEAPDENSVLEAWWNETCPILRNAVPRGLKLEFDGAETPPVRIAPHLLTQAIFNLVQNAGEALRGREAGVIRVWAAAEPARAGHVRIGVTDNGPGMPAEVAARCFDPFYTTKTRSISTGLGLALVNGIVQKAGGTLDVHSVEGEGTTFSFTIGAAAQDGEERPVAVISLADQRVRGFAAGLLQVAGFDVQSSLPPLHQGPALLVTDPGPDMEAVAASFRGGNPRRRVLVHADRAARLPEGVVGFRLAGETGTLRQQVREFVAECVTSDPAPEPEDARA